MKLLLHLETNSDIDVVLGAVYAFSPTYMFKHVGNGVLETTIDASQELTDSQWSVINSDKYNIAFVQPTPPVTPPSP